MPALVAVAALTLCSTAFAQQAPFPPPQPPRARAAGAVGQTSPYIGVGIMDIDPSRAKALKLKEERGAEITQLVPGGPAEKAGLKVNDVILEYDGQRVEGLEQLQRMVRESVPGRVVKLGIWRNGAMMTVNVTIELHRESAMEIVTPRGVWGVDAPDYWPMGQLPIDIPHIQTIMQNSMLGVECEPLGDEQQFAEYFGVKDGLLVKMVAAGSPASHAGIKAGDVIVKVDETRVGAMRELSGALRIAAQKGSYQVTVMRNKKEMQVTVLAQ